MRLRTFLSTGKTSKLQHVLGPIFGALACCAFGMSPAVRARIAPRATVPFRLDHHRVLVTGRIVGASVNHRIDLWIDNGNPELWVTERIAQELAPLAPRPLPDTLALIGVLHVGSVSFDLARAGVAHVIRDETIAPGLPALMNVPATLLRDSDLELDYPNRRVRLGSMGSLRLDGDTVDAYVSPRTALLALPIGSGAEQAMMGLDIGASASFVRATRLCTDPSVGNESVATGAFGSANLFGDDVELRWRVVALGAPRLRSRSGTSTLSGGLAVCLDDRSMDAVSSRSDLELQGLLGGNMLEGLRVLISPRRKLVVVRRDRTPVIRYWPGMTLRPLRDGEWLIAGVTRKGDVSLAGDAAAGDTLETVRGRSVRRLSMGETWSLLSSDREEAVSIVVRRRGERVRLAVPVTRLRPRELR